jgi:hypothetical protein
MTSERLEVQRMIEADPAAIFRVLCDPQGHVAIDSSGMLMDGPGTGFSGSAATRRPTISRRPATGGIRVGQPRAACAGDCSAD